MINFTHLFYLLRGWKSFKPMWGKKNVVGYYKKKGKKILVQVPKIIWKKNKRKH